MPLIANIIENARKWRRTLREKVTGEIDEETPEDDETDSIRQHNPLHKHLWSLLRSNLRNEIRIRSAARKAHGDLEAAPNEFFSDDALSSPPVDNRAELLSCGFDNWEQDDTQQYTYSTMQPEQDLNDYEPTEEEDNSGPASIGQSMHLDESIQEYVVDEMENGSAYPDSEGPYDDVVHDDLSPDHLPVREHHSQLRHFSRGQET